MAGVVPFAGDAAGVACDARRNSTHKPCWPATPVSPARKNTITSTRRASSALAQHLIDMQGRSYLDMLNNVAVLGHGHPRMAAVAARQWSLLNTNSRFNYAAVAEFSERLLKLAPEGMDRVFLVNSGSEANDLAIRLAWAYSGGATCSACWRPITAGRSARMRYRRRLPTTPRPGAAVRTGCTR
jgi:4-aminobutyrate aminotransferase-like enzyme